MGSCIICGTTTEGAVCSLHEEDVAFVFEGDSPDQLTPGRYYRGVVDGFADFGVFVDVGDSVTGLLHRSEIDRRLESLEWEPGDTVYVQVTGIRDNGNIDLGWSIRQSTDEFRGLLVDAPEGTRQPDDQREDEPEEPAAAQASPEPSGGTRPEEGTGTAESTSVDETAERSDEVAREETADEEGESAEDAQPEGDTTSDQTFARTPITDLPDLVGEAVRIEGEVTGVRQTSGPTIFELRDESGTVECAAFEGAGVRAFPEVDVGDYVRLDGEVEQRRGDLQVETETLLVLGGEERDEVRGRIEDAVEEAVRPDDVTLPAEDDPVAGLSEEIVEAATAIRRAIKEARPVVVRHAATADGYAAGAAIERAVLPRLREEHARSDAEYHYFERRPLDDPVYGMDAVTDDLTRMLETRDRHGERLPLVVLVGLGSTEEAIEAFDLLDVYGVERVVIDVVRPDEGLAEAAATVVNPHLGDADPDRLTSAALATGVAATVAPDELWALEHVPAVSYWESPPEAYAEVAEAAGYDLEKRRRIREALALEANYQAYNDKRELVADLLFGDLEDLAGHVADQFREKLEDELETARAHVSRRQVDGTELVVLDADAFTHRFDFPPTALLVEALHRRERDDADGALVTLGLEESRLRVRSTEPVDVRELAADVGESVPGIVPVGGRDGHLEFLVGTRDEVLEAAVEALAERTP